MPKGQYDRGEYACRTCRRTFFSKQWFQRHVQTTEHNAIPTVRARDGRYQPYRRDEDAVEKYDISIITDDMHVIPNNNVPLKTCAGFVHIPLHSAMTKTLMKQKIAAPAAAAPLKPRVTPTRTMTLTPPIFLIGSCIFLTCMSYKSYLNAKIAFTARQGFPCAVCCNSIKPGNTASLESLNDSVS
jgi:hypothetical protein